METILTWLTLVVIALVVLVIAVYLILIALTLIRANRNLSQLVGGLRAIRENAAPLGEDMTTINNAAVALRDKLMAVDAHLLGIIKVVGTK